MCCAVTSLAAPKEYYLGRTAVKMQAEGIEFKPFRDMVPEQIKPLSAQTLRSSNGTEVEVYEFNKLWLRGQTLASYYNKGIKIDFYKLNYLPPDVKPLWKNYIKESSFQSGIAKAKWDESTITKWVKSLTGKSVKIENKYPKLTFGIKQRWMEMGQQSGQYDFLIIANDGRFFFMHAEAKIGTDKEKLKAVTDFLKNIRINRPRAVAASNQSSRVKPKGQMTAKYQATVQKVIQEVANTKGWWYAQTPNYILKSNLDSRSKTLAKKVQVRVEVMRKVYEAFMPPEKKIEDISVITFPNTREEYMKYSDAPSWSAGVWNPSRKELVVSPLQGASKRTAELQMMNTLHHEAFHQYIFYAFNQKVTPPWFNEGHADLFSSVKVIGSKVTVIEDQYALRTLSNHIKRKSLALANLINADYQQFYANKDVNYPLAWSLVYFLQKGGSLYKSKGYDKIIPKVIEEMVQYGNMKKATEKGFAGINMKTFQDDFYSFWNDKRMRSKAARIKIVASR